MRFPRSPRARLAAPVLGAGLALVLTGCGGSDRAGRAPNTVQSGSTPTAPPSTTSAPTAPPPTSSGSSTDTGTDTTPSDGTGGTGGTPSGGGGGSSGGVYPNQPAPNPNQSPQDRFKQYCAKNPGACGE